MSEQDWPRVQRRLELLEQRLAKLERFSSVITSTQELTLFRDSGKVAARLGKVSSTGRTALEINSTDGETVEARFGKLAAHTGHGAEVRSTTGGYVKLAPLVTPLIASATGLVSTVSTSYVSLAGDPAVTATIGPTGRALVTVSAFLSAISNMTAFMSFAVSGATTITASDVDALACGSANSADAIRASAEVLVTGLSSGSNTFTAKYSQSLPGATDSADFQVRSIRVQPF